MKIVLDRTWLRFHQIIYINIALVLSLSSDVIYYLYSQQINGQFSQQNVATSYSQEFNSPSQPQSRLTFMQHYQLVIQNHSIENQFTIENQFAHNYEYVYKLWKCKPVERQLIKIQMFEKVLEGDKHILAKRGEASPLVNYTFEGQKFQFYASNEQRCVLILKFKAISQQQIDQQTNREKLYNLNRNMSQILQGNRFQGQEHAKYLDHTNQLIYNWNKNVETSTISLNPFRQQQEPTKYKKEMRPQVIKLNTNRDSRKDFVLSNAKYLNGDFEVSLNHTTPAQTLNRRLVRPKTEAQNACQGLQLSIKKRRELYLCNKVDTILQKPSESPILSVYKSEVSSKDRQRSEEKQKFQRIKIDHQAQTDRIQSKKKFPPLINQSEDYSTPQTYKQIHREQISEDNEHAINPKTGTDEIVRATNFPQENPRYQPGIKQFGTIRRKKSVSQNKDRDPNQDTRIRPFEEGSITHISRNSRISKTLKDKYINLNLYNFKASLYQSKGRCLRKLVLVFQDSRYATESVQCLNLKANWKQRFGIRNCIQSSYLYCRLYCDEQQEGQATINIRELSQSNHNNCRVFFYFQQLAVGYLDFDFTKSEYTPIASNQDFGELQGNRLPKIRNDQLPRGLDRNDYSMPLSRKGSMDKQTNPSKSKKRILLLKQRDPISRNDERSLGKAAKNEGSGITKIRQKKLKLKCKIK